MSKTKNFKGLRNGFENNPQNINRNGRPKSATQHLKDLFNQEERYFIPLDRVEVTVEGVYLNLPTAKDLAATLMDIALTGEGNVQLKAIEMIIDRIDGKPRQTVEINDVTPRRIGYGNDPEFFGQEE